MGSAATAEPTPTQNQYPVWYFFYGTLGNPDVLKRLLGVDPIYRPASVAGGEMIEWGGKYKALIDAPGSAVEGVAFMVEREEVEDALRCYETDKDEVVRCEIGMKDDKSVAKGLTDFPFCCLPVRQLLGPSDMFPVSARRPRDAEPDFF